MPCWIHTKCDLVCAVGRSRSDGWYRECGAVQPVMRAWLIDSRGLRMLRYVGCVTQTRKPISRPENSWLARVKCRTDVWCSVCRPFSIDRFVAYFPPMCALRWYWAEVTKFPPPLALAAHVVVVGTTGRSRCPGRRRQITTTDIAGTRSQPPHQRQCLLSGALPIASRWPAT